MKKGAFAFVVLAAALASPVLATDYTISWTCVLGGSLSSGGSTFLTGLVNFGADNVLDNDANFTFPDAMIGDGTGIDAGTLTIFCDLAVGGPYLFTGLTVDLIGQLKAGTKALNPQIAWTEKVFDTTSGSVQVVNDSGTDFSQPTTRSYSFGAAKKLHIEETFNLSGVTYKDNQGQTQIDQDALAALTLVEKSISVVVPEPNAIAGLVAVAGVLAAYRLRRK